MQAVDETAAYGSACEACARAKCRCITRGHGERCERCNRLDKTCLPTITKRRLKPDNVRTGRVTKSPGVPGASRIERKLDDLVTMLSSKSADTAFAARTPAEESEASSLGHQYPDLTALEADEGLVTFAAHMFKFFPFVYIPPNTTASELSAQRPFLVLCMAAISSRQAERQGELFAMMRETIAQKLVVDCTVEPSIDLLLGLLTFLGWLSCLPRPSIDKVRTAGCVFVRLAISTAINLGLTQPVQSDPAPLRCFQVSHPRTAPVQRRTMEERRAVLACFLISSGFARSDPLHWTPCVGECLSILEREQESPLDAILVQRVKINRVVEKANLALSYHATFEEDSASAALPSIYVQPMQTDLDRLKHDLPHDMQQNATLEIFHNTAKLQIRYMAVSWADSRSHEQPNLTQLSNFSACVDLIEAVFVKFNNVALVDYIGIPFAIFTHLRLCLGMLLHLSTMDRPGWDKMEVRRRIDVLTVADQMADNFSRASVLYSGGDERSARRDESGDPLARTGEHLRIMRNAFAAKVEQSDGEGIISALTPTSAEDVSLTELPDMADFLDLDWLVGMI